MRDPSTHKPPMSNAGTWANAIRPVFRRTSATQGDLLRVDGLLTKTASIKSLPKSSNKEEDLLLLSFAVPRALTMAVLRPTFFLEWSFDTLLQALLVAECLTRMGRFRAMTIQSEIFTPIT